jgi:hypothetical protein
MRAVAAALIRAALRVNIGSILHLKCFEDARHFAPIAATVFALRQTSVSFASVTVLRRFT